MNTETVSQVSRKKYHIKKDDIYTGLVDIDDLMQHSFHLPVDVLTNKDWSIEGPVVLSPDDIPTRFIDQLEVEGNSYLFWNAHKVAISARKHVESGIEYFVGRIWFGKEIK